MKLDIFCSVVYSIEEINDRLEQILIDTNEILEKVSTNFEILLIDVCKDKSKSIPFLKKITENKKISNLSVLITKDGISLNKGNCVGLDKTIGDFIFIFNPYLDDLNMIPTMLNEASNGNEIVIAYNKNKATENFIYKFSRKIFYNIYKTLNKSSIIEDLYPYRLISKRIANHILKDKNAEHLLRHVPNILSYKKKDISYSSKIKTYSKTYFFYSLKKALNLLIMTSNAPIRLISLLSIFGAAINVIYSIYVVIIAILKTNVAEGWLTLSLQQSGMFFLISLFFLILSEYILKINIGSENNLSEDVVEEFNSKIKSQKESINIKEIK
jgi:hypothetical protein|tara:strand:- start:6018 stop:6998 length:981 start_codon:yes stop_codon:yes gene_type:complete